MFAGGKKSRYFAPLSMTNLWEKSRYFAPLRMTIYSQAGN